MRCAIDTAPKDGTVVVLEDDAAEEFELGHWSVEDEGWVSESGKPCRMDPIYWHTVQRSALQQETDDASTLMLHPAARAMALAGAQLNRFELPEILALGRATNIDRGSLAETRDAQKPHRDWRRFAGVSIGAAMVLISLLGMYFRDDIVANTHRADQAGSLRAKFESKRTAGQISPLPPLPGAADKGLSESVAAEAGMSELQATLAKERAKSTALEIELKNARRELVTQAVRVAEASDEARQSAKTTADLKQALARETAQALALQNERVKATVKK